jgi:hypothetical protein
MTDATPPAEWPTPPRRPRPRIDRKHDPVYLRLREEMEAREIERRERERSERERVPAVS